jgi:hypothetical protein
MRHLFVESNWVYASCSPEHLREPAAIHLLQKARHGELRLHLPAICLREGADAIRKKCQPRIPEEMRKFLRAARLGGRLPVEHTEIVTQALELYRSTVSHELRTLDETVESVRNTPGVEAFALSEDMLERAIQLRTGGPSGLKPFDEAILAAVLAKARALRTLHAGDPNLDLAFCTLDGDLQPWTKERTRLEPLASLYEQEGLRVYGDFAAVAGAS